MQKTIFRNVQILDGTGSEPFSGALLIEGNKIAQVARDGQDLPIEGAAEIDGRGATLMPGMINAHAHPSFADTAQLHTLGEIPPEEHTLVTMRNVKLLLDQGFTSIFSAASAKPRLDIVIRNAINKGEIPGPRMLAATPEMTVTSGLGDLRLSHLHRESFAVICDGADDFRRTAREFLREGVDTLKINISGDEFVPHARGETMVMTEEEVAAVCEVAKKHGKNVAAHARSSESVQACVRHGIRFIYHATFIDEATIDLLEANKHWVYIAPTIGITYATLHEAAEWGITTEDARAMGFERELEMACQSMKELHRRGVKVLPGGDYGFAWNLAGRDARDLEHFVNLLGFSPLEAITAATGKASAIMGMDEGLGLLQKGAPADLLLVDGNPLEDIRILQDQHRFLAIMKDGTFHKSPIANQGSGRAAA